MFGEVVGRKDGVNFISNWLEFLRVGTAEMDILLENGREGMAGKSQTLRCYRTDC